MATSSAEESLPDTDDSEAEAVSNTEEPSSDTKKQTNLSWLTSSKKSLQKWAILPSYRRNSTYGHIFGGRFFIYPTGNTGYYTSLDAFINKDWFFSSSASYKYWWANGDELKFIALYDAFSEPYYGEGGDTQSEDRKDIPIDKIHAELEYVANIDSDLYGGGFIRFDHRKEKEGGKEFFPWELTLSIGALLRYDSRDNYFNPSKGEFYQLKTWLNARHNSPLFLEGDARLYFSPLPGLILTTRGLLGLSFLNEPSYVFRYSLGGSDLLRGYRLNRFRGNQYYLSQTELRYTIWKFLTFSGFFDFGAIEEKTLSAPYLYSYGGGIHFGLPPDYNKKIRVEFGKGKDQYNFVVAFGYPF